MPDDSRVKLKIQPANTWGWSETLLNKATYLLELIAWQNTDDAAKGRSETAPKMYTPPFMAGRIGQALDPEQETHTTDEIEDILKRERA